MTKVYFCVQKYFPQVLGTTNQFKYRYSHPGSDIFNNLKSIYFIYKIAIKYNLTARISMAVTVPLKILLVMTLITIKCFFLDSVEQAGLAKLTKDTETAIQT